MNDVLSWLQLAPILAFLAAALTAGPKILRVLFQFVAFVIAVVRSPPHMTAQLARDIYGSPAEPPGRPKAIDSG